ncbi:MAG: hypothetical protein FLDDKLPJ_02315 [Phycisphaerae bacterium]|nr:hypothetical protein [Phycisphaerae bacterium]
MVEGRKIPSTSEAADLADPLPMPLSTFLRAVEGVNSIVGCALIGSRAIGHGFVRADSDFDLCVIAADVGAARHHLRSNNCPPILDVSFILFADIPDRLPHWQLYGLAWSRVLYDTTGRLASQLHSLRVLSASECDSVIRDSAAAFIECAYRSLRSEEQALTLAARLEACRALEFLLRLLFAIDGRRAPYSKYLLWELRQRPLSAICLPTDRLCELTSMVIDSPVCGLVTVARQLTDYLRDSGRTALLDQRCMAKLQYLGSKAWAKQSM